MENLPDKPLQQWSDNEIRQALRFHHGLSSIPPITPLTRPFLERKLEDWIHRTASASDVCSVESVVDSSLSNSVNHNGPPTAAQTSTERVEAYYGVVGPSTASITTASQLSPFYTSKSDALKAIKNVPGARFKKFDSQAGAEAFSSRQTQLQDESLEQTDSPASDVCFNNSTNVDIQSVCEKPNNFPSLKTPDLSNFRMMIEKGDVESFLSCIETNPRYLITSGDAPPLLKMGVEYNALHCAVKSRQLEICQLLLAVIESDKFWEMVYRDDTDSVRLLRKHHLLDLYLNRQDKGLGETPLHFACKHGYDEIVSFLMTFTLMSTAVSNKYGKTPAEVVCENVKTPTPGLAKKIKESLRGPEIYYVPVFRTEDNSTPPSLGKPCTLEQLEEAEAQVDRTGLHRVSNGLAGPMSPCDAQRFYQDWKTPSDSSERKEAAGIKRSDSERGLERIGRQLAHRNEVDWEEYWDFLGCSCDLSRPEGQQLLEEFLQTKTNEKSSAEHLQGSPIDIKTNGAQNEYMMMPESPLHNLNTRANEDCAGSPVHVSDVLRKLFTEDESEGCIEEAGVMEVDDTEQEGNASDDIDGLPEMLSTKLSLEPQGKPMNSDQQNTDNKLFIMGAFPTKMDRDVLLALGDIHPDPSKYPNINRWLGNVRRFSEKEQKNWRTPQKHGVVGFDHTTSPLPVSSLVFSSPSAPMHSYPYNSSPLVTSGTSMNKSVQDTRTTPTQHPLAQRPYGQRQSTTPRGRHTPVSIRVRSTNTTPRRRGQKMRMTPTSLTGYGRHSLHSKADIVTQ